MFDVTNFLVRWLFLCNLVRDIAEIQLLPFHPYQPPPPTSPVPCDAAWKDQCLRGIVSYPPGSQRRLVIDAMRIELVNRLSVSLQNADSIIRRHESFRRHEEGYRIPLDTPTDAPTSTSTSTSTRINYTGLDADDGIMREVEKEMNVTNVQEEHPTEMPVNQTAPSPEEVREAQRTIRIVRDYLPQLVSVVLKSPPSSEPNLLDPVDKLRELVVHRCIDDANWGIAMCWLLEAEVGKAWKTLFEHKQQTGRRLIVVLPAEKAAVLAKIGTKKREAFDLLQDSEQATAYGIAALNYLTRHRTPQDANEMLDAETQSRPLASIGLQRCRHFGDTMHFVDRLTKISSEMRTVPQPHRSLYLQEQLKELNRRIRRRMITQGRFSLDVEDNQGPDGWPQLGDLSWDMLRHSVHLPLEPLQQSQWPGASQETTQDDEGVVKVLNVVVEEARTLSSRERCPFLVHVEVEQTSLSGTDARLYASQATGLGATVEEALALKTGQAPLSIPAELLQPLQERSPSKRTPGPAFIRGGYQGSEMFYPDSDYSYWSSPHVHPGQGQNPHNNVVPPHPQLQNLPPNEVPPHYVPSVTTGETLLNQVFGQPWAKKCEAIRQASLFGKRKGWKLASFIVKAGEDIRREALVMQIIRNLNKWFEEEIPEANRPTLRPYTIMCVGGDSGLVECLSDVRSIDEIKKSTDGFVSLQDFFMRSFGAPAGNPNGEIAGSAPSGSISYDQARENFLRSLVGYSLVCYILQIKDRHNANILMDRNGHVMHIDFGFVLGDTPKMGKLPIFSERAPFKLSNEFWDVLGGWNVHQGGLGVRFCHMFEQAFACASAHTEEIASLVEATMLTLSPDPRHARFIADGVRARLRMRGLHGSGEQKVFIMELVNAALTSWGTTTYDWLQKNMNGYQ